MIEEPTAVSKVGTHRVLLICLSVFLLSFLIRTLTWQDNKRDAWRVQTAVTAGYKDSAHQLARGDLKTFVSDINHLGHPPGYPILLAALFRTVGGDSDTALQFIQITCDAIAVVLLFLITLELLPLAVAVISGLLAALSPQFAYFSVRLLPDSLIVLPILLAIYLIARSTKHFHLLHFLLAGGLIGLSCWLRANALLMAPFLALLAPLIVQPGQRRKAAAAILAGAVLVIAPITIKNAIVFRRFIPLSLGAGQTLLEGIADYDKEGRFNIPTTDLGIMRQEAQWYGKPEYALWLFGEDGIDRDRMRVARGFAVIRSHPLWFAGVMVQRALASTRLDPVPVLAPESPVSHDINSSGRRLVWVQSATQLNEATRGPKTSFIVEGEWLRVVGDDSSYGHQLSSDVIEVTPFHDYVLRLPLKLEVGRSVVKVTTVSETKVLASLIIDVVEGVEPQDQPVNHISLPFVSANNSQVKVMIGNSAVPNPIFLVGRVELIELGPSSFTSLRYVRIPVRIIQYFYKTAWVLPFVVLGLGLMIAKRRFRELAIILVVPAYYLTVQSALHTERRYVYVLHFFFSILVGAALWWGIDSLLGLIRRRRGQVAEVDLKI